MAKGWKERAIAAEKESSRLRDLINTPKINEFLEGVKIEAAYQRDRWPAGHDASKTQADWFWLIGWLGGKAVHNPIKTGERSKHKRLHRIITVGAAAFNWWRTVNDMGEDLTKIQTNPNSNKDALL